MYIYAIISELLKLNIVFIGFHNYTFNTYIFIPQSVNLECHLVVKKRIGNRMSIENDPFNT